MGVHGASWAMINFVFNRKNNAVWVIPVFAYACSSMAIASTIVSGYDVTLKQAQQYIRKGDSKKANLILMKMNKEFPGNQEVIAVLAKLRCDNNNFIGGSSIINSVPARERKTELLSAINECGQLKELHRAKNYLRVKDFDAAIRITSKLYFKHSHTYTSGLMLAKAYIGKNELGEASNIYGELSKIYPKDRSLKLSAKNLSEKIRLYNAQNFVRQKKYGAAIRIARPIFIGGKNKYRAGLILANAYIKENKQVQAKEVYSRLAMEYPKDKELGRLSSSMATNLKLNEAEYQFKQGNVSSCIKLAEPIYAKGYDQYRSGLILARAYESEQRTNEAIEIYNRLAKLYPNDKNLSSRYFRLRDGLIINNSKLYYKKGNYQKAIDIAKPVYASGKDEYQAGLIIAKSYAALHEPRKSSEIYRALSEKYPSDKELTRGYLLSKLWSHDYYGASGLYQKLDLADKKKIDTALGIQARKLYRYALTLGGGYAIWSNPYPGEHYFNVRMRGYTPIGTIIGTLYNDQRYGVDASSYGVEYYRKLKDKYSGYLLASYSPQNTILAHYSYTLGLVKYLHGMDLIGSYRRLEFNHSNANVWFLGIAKYITSTLNIKTGVYYVPKTSAYSLLIAPICYESRGETFMYISGGQMGEQLNVQGNIYRAPSYSIKLGQRIYLSKRFSTTIDAFYEHRGHLYERKGIEAYVTWRW